VSCCDRPDESKYELLQRIIEEPKRIPDQISIAGISAEAIIDK